MITTITAKHLIIYISIYIFVQYTYLLLLTSISISRGGKSLSYRLVGFSEISPPQSLFQLFTDFKFNVIYLFIMFLLLLSVIYFVWQNKNADHFNIKVNPPITGSVGRMAITANGILKLKISQNRK